MDSSARTLQWPDRFRVSPSTSGPLTACLILALLAGATLLVYTTGGTKLAWPYLMLVPVLIAAARFQVAGGLLVGLAGGLLLGPFMPLDVGAGTPQETANWLVRLAFYTGLGGFTGLLFWLIRRESEHREREARVDTDSGLPNKTALAETLERRRLDDGPLPLLCLIRVIDLAEIIEVAGIGAADVLMRDFARRLREGIDPRIEVYRFSASELMTLHPPRTTDPETAAQAILRAAETPMEIRGVPVHIELALGSAGTGGERIEPRELVRRTRVALFNAVENQLPHRSYKPELEQRSTETVRLLGRVRRGLERGEFELHYQPKIHAATGHAGGCEALVRWRDPDSGDLIPPGRFMPRVEHSALIGPLTRFVTRSACEFTRRTGGCTSLNLSARNLLDNEVLDTLVDIAAADRFPEGCIEAEITEGAIMRDPETARRSIERLRGCGIRVSIDDFGTGYSSFEYLRWLPLTGLKIDRVFIRDLGEDPAAERLLACMIDVGHALDLEVVAEGVETPQQFEILQRLGCDLVQGFLFARPMPEAEYLDWRHRHTATAMP